jgi:hypothetical protein
MYALFIDQAWKWRQADPEAQIRLADVGFSRGAEQAAGFARLVHKRGIQDHTGAVYERDSSNKITGVHYTKPPLVAPGQVIQAEGLFDAVGTGEPYKHDRRPPPSVISGLHIMALDERRGAFPSDRIIDPGLSPDGRFLGLEVAGAHSDVGGSYHRNGLAIRSGNMMMDYLNALSDQPFLQKGIEPDDPRLNVVHRSEEAFPYNWMNKGPRDQPGGSNERLVPEHTEIRRVNDPGSEIGYRMEVIRSEQPGVIDPRNAEPLDKSLLDGIERHPLGGAAQPQPFQSAPSQPSQPQSQADPGNDVWARVERMLAAAQTGDWKSFRADTQALAALPAAQQMRAEARATVDMQEQQQAAQQMLEAQQRAAQQQEAPAMRMSR